MKKKLNANTLILAGASLAALLVMYLVVPNTSSVYIMTVLNGALIFYVACLGITVILGMGGMVSFAAITFMGVGAYTSANLTLKLGVPTIASMLGAVAVSMALALVIGAILLRLKGTFFTFATVALVQISYSIFTNWKAVTGGPDGMGGIATFEFFGVKAVKPNENYMVLLTVGILCALFVLRLKKTNLGRALSSVRDNEIAAKIMGVNVYRTKLAAFVIAAALAGLAGSLMVHNYHFVGSSSFTFDQSTTFVIMAMLGGVSNPFGVFLGSVLISMLPEWLKPLQEYIRLVYGLGVMLLMVFMPMGLWGLFTSWVKKFKAKLKLGQKTVVGASETQEE